MEEPPKVITTPSDPWPRPYYLEGGLRRVAPYHFTYNTNCKERWRGKTLLHIFVEEFRDRNGEYYVSSVLNCLGLWFLMFKICSIFFILVYLWNPIYIIILFSSIY